MSSIFFTFLIEQGGVDAAITRFFGDQLQKRVQKHIVEEYGGQQHTGTSFIIDTLSDK